MFQSARPPEPAPIRDPDPEVTVITGREGPLRRRYSWQAEPPPEPESDGEAER
ncbi:hypothetical protein [Streptomyces avicenniae]|uniref:hypothetical protein n=1 Tax=Streptomyces avicenniae TaxID=500153 RepID=UPI000AAB1A3C|nr:hypothetical protein [Streptomyces avicenniae]